jgi:hypothetical protein
MAELAEIKRPSIDSFSNKRKLYCVPNIYSKGDTHEELRELIEKYWDEVEKQLQRLEVAGRVKKIFCENLYVEGQKGLEILSKLNEYAYRIVKTKFEEGAELVALEDKRILGTFLDWRNCLAIVQTGEVYERVLKFFRETYQRRIEHVQKVIDENIGEAEAALLIITDEDRLKLQFPSDIEVFLVTPPTYDDILRWLRDNLEKIAKK